MGAALGRCGDALPLLRLLGVLGLFAAPRWGRQSAGGGRRAAGDGRIAACAMAADGGGDGRATWSSSHWLLRGDSGTARQHQRRLRQVALSAATALAAARSGILRYAVAAAPVPVRLLPHGHAQHCLFGRPAPPGDAGTVPRGRC